MDPKKRNLALGFARKRADAIAGGTHSFVSPSFRAPALMNDACRSSKVWAKLAEVGLLLSCSMLPSQAPVSSGCAGLLSLLLPGSSKENGVPTRLLGRK